MAENRFTYAIAFNTKEMPGKVIATTVTIGTAIVDAKDQVTTVRVDLCDHPKYSELVDYCLANPPMGMKVTRKPA